MGGESRLLFDYRTGLRALQPAGSRQVRVHVVDKVGVELVQGTELLLELGNPRRFLVVDQRLFAGEDFQVGDVLLGVLVDEIIGQRQDSA